MRQIVPANPSVARQKVTPSSAAIAENEFKIEISELGELTASPLSAAARVGVTSKKNVGTDSASPIRTATNGASVIQPPQNDPSTKPNSSTATVPEPEDAVKNAAEHIKVNASCSVTIAEQNDAHAANVHPNTEEGRMPEGDEKTKDQQQLGPSCALPSADLENAGGGFHALHTTQKCGNVVEPTESEALTTKDVACRDRDGIKGAADAAESAVTYDTPAEMSKETVSSLSSDHENENDNELFMSAHALSDSDTAFLVSSAE